MHAWCRSQVGPFSLVNTRPYSFLDVGLDFQAKLLCDVCVMVNKTFKSSTEFPCPSSYLHGDTQSSVPELCIPDDCPGVNKANALFRVLTIKHSNHTFSNVCESMS